MAINFNRNQAQLMIMLYHFLPSLNAVMKGAASCSCGIAVVRFMGVYRACACPIHH